MERGIGASLGVAVGRVMIKEEVSFEIEEISVENFETEIDRFKDALIVSKEQLKKIEESARENIGEDEAMIFASHMMMLEDPVMTEEIKDMIKADSVVAEWAVKTIRDRYVSMFEAMDNEYMRERSHDVLDVTGRIINNLFNIKPMDFSSLKDPVILVSRDLAPSDTAQIPKDKVMGFITEIGGPTSHTAIMSRTLEIPAIVGTGDILSKVKDGDLIAMDGTSGEYHINPAKALIEQYENRKKKHEEEKIELQNMIGVKTKTLDGHRVEIACNIGKPSDMEFVHKNDGEGIGLFRSEFLYMDRTNLPTEEEQYEAYSEVAKSMNNRPVVIRTLDIGGDKDIPYMEFEKEMNPFLGHRAIRYCLSNREVFKVQLRAISRASVHGKIKIMFPMISSVEEILEAKKILKECHDELEKENIEFDKHMEVGIMIEIPAAAIMSDMLAKEVDFFSIGTNDLLQYTTAVDRMNENISHLYSPYHPALLRLVNMVIENGQRNNIWVGMCGEVAGNLKLIPVLLGMGLNEFSMSPSSVLRARRRINSLNKEKLEVIKDQVLSMSSATEVENYLNELF